MGGAVGGRVDHSVRGRAQPTVGQALEHVADIDDQLAGLRADRDPAAIASPELEPGFLGAEQQGNGIDVLVRAGADVLAGRLRLGRVMEHAEHRIAVVHGVGEIVLVEPKEARDRG